MEFSYDKVELRSICEFREVAERILGTEAAAMLAHRLADLHSAKVLTRDLLAGRPRLVEGASGQEMVLDLADGYELVLSANHPKNPITELGTIDWAKVRRIRILRIVRDHASSN